MSVDAPPEFFDTNVLVYADDTSAGEKHTKALALFTRCVTTEVAVLSIQVLQEFFVTVTSKIPNPLAPGEAYEIVSDLAKMPTHNPSATDVLGAIDLHRRIGLTFWDSMILRSAHILGCSTVWSEDLADGHLYDGVEVRNPFSS